CARYCGGIYCDQYGLDSW
nr:immunoglobulin heavy chain junction region [Macaca mulatta]MOW46424.1 immunoglobulin heavy chain junction region [Macaca mulatta]MOW47193.1 immunoglobulin heavy chain junction region [Macaca mulatta]MOW47485.1 immunoglobulin heavy chain junction region [Macaca mulatta]MOW47637.1 immunoglobulin heavy chain junction region [Macaca mulatta]